MPKKCVYCHNDIPDDQPIHKQQQRDAPHDSDIKMSVVVDLWDKTHMLTQEEFAKAFNGTTLTYEGLLYTFYTKLWRAKPDG